MPQQTPDKRVNMMKNSATTVLPATEPVFVYNTQFNS